ncbi:MAG: nucleoside deaminase [Candidatus Babeliales bacterium]|jgi:tRNA(adenine34) deaminase
MARFEYEQFMDKALAQAQKAFETKEVPIGAVITNPSGIIIAAGYNQVESQKSQTAHAELLALRSASQNLGDWRLDGCILYVTLEPCTMCYAAIQLSRIKHIVYGAQSPVFGYKKDQDCFIKPFDTQITIIGGIKADQCARLLQLFFQTQRL